MELILIFGSCGLIGSEIFKTLNKKNLDVYGFDIAKNIDSKKIIELDLNDFDRVDELFSLNIDFMTNYSKINIIYLSAIDSKLGQPWAPLHEFIIDDWKKFSSTNQDALLFLTSKFIDARVKNILNADLNFILFPSLYNFIAPNQEAYDSEMKVMKPFYYIGSKALTRDLNKYINSTYAHLNVSSNCLVPHLVVDKSQVIKKSILDKTLTKNATNIDDIVKAAEFLIDRPKNMIGQEIVVDGGWSIV